MNKNENYQLRKLLWLHHGCHIDSLYGDDGEMQCQHCLIDFKRDSIEDIASHFTQKPDGFENLFENQKDMRKNQCLCPGGIGICGFGDLRTGECSHPRR